MSIDRAERPGASSAERLLPLVYAELRKLPAAKMAREAPGRTLQPTALVHEAWLRLGGDEQNLPARAREADLRVKAEANEKKAQLEAARSGQLAQFLRGRLGWALIAAGDPPEAEARLREALALEQQMPAIDPGPTRRSLANALSRQNKLAEAESVSRELVALSGQLRLKDEGERSARMHLGLTLMARGRHAGIQIASLAHFP